MKKKYMVYSFILMAVLVLTSCISTETAVSDDVATEDTNSKTVLLYLDAGTPLELDDSSLVITLYGYDPFLADAPATEIVSHRYVVKELPATVSVPVPLDPDRMIYPELSKVANPEYYVRVDAVSSGNKVIADFNRGFPIVELSSVLQEVYLKVVE